jgi:hypothetical protein
VAKFSGLTEIFFNPFFFLPKIAQKRGNKELSSFQLSPFSISNRSVSNFPTKFGKNRKMKKASISVGRKLKNIFPGKAEKRE